jgi:hypothetical protein
MLSVVMLNVTKKSIMFNVVRLNVAIKSIMLYVIRLNVVAPKYWYKIRQKSFYRIWPMNNS